MGRTAFEYSVLLFQQHLMHLMNALRDLRLSEIGAARCLHRSQTVRIKHHLSLIHI